MIRQPAAQPLSPDLEHVVYELEYAPPAGSSAVRPAKVVLSQEPAHDIRSDLDRGAVELGLTMDRAEGHAWLPVPEAVEEPEETKKGRAKAAGK